MTILRTSYFLRAFAWPVLMGFVCPALSLECAKLGTGAGYQVSVVRGDKPQESAPSAGPASERSAAESEKYFLVFGTRGTGATLIKRNLARLRQKGYKILRVQIAYAQGSQFKFDTSLAAKGDLVVTFNDPKTSPEAVAEQIRSLNLNIVGVEPGNDEWVPYSRYLLRKLGLSHSDQAVDLNDKSAWVKKLLEAGLAAPLSELVSSVDEVMSFIQTHGLKPRRDGKPFIILKPKDSSGTQGFVEIFGTPEGQIDRAEIEQKLRVLLSLKTDTGKRIEKAMVQKSLVGVEYASNWLIEAHRANQEFDYVHYSLLRYYKKNPGRFYDFDLSLDLARRSYRIRTMEEYLVKVFKVLGIDPGAVHAELFWTEEGPVLVDIANRLMGGDEPVMESVIIDRDVYHLTADAALNEGNLSREFPKGYANLKKYGVYITLTNHLGPRILNPEIGPYWEEITKLESYLQGNLSYQPGQLVEKASSMFEGTYGIILLANDNRKKLLEDVRYIRTKVPFLIKIVKGKEARVPSGTKVTSK